MKKTYLKNGGIAVHRLASCLLFTVFVLVAPHIEYFKAINNNLDLLLTAIGATTLISWILILTIPTQGFPFFIEISDRGITQRWFGKIQATIDWNDVEKIEKASAVFTEWQPKMENAFKENILKKFQELLGDKVDEQRVMTEVASLMVKYTINEEIVRLKSHIKSIYKEITENSTPGKRLDFICQEMNREINTIGSKNQFIEIAEQVINAKDALENIREQSKNIE